MIQCRIMKIGVISDIHGYYAGFEKAQAIFKECDVILCAGDTLNHGPGEHPAEGYDPARLVESIKSSPVPVLVVKGNCESDAEKTALDMEHIPEVAIYDKDGVVFYLFHGDKVDQDGQAGIAKRFHCDFMITGHTHIRKFEMRDGVAYVNPGSSSLPQGEDKIPSVALIEDKRLTFYNIDLAEPLETFDL